MGSVGGRPVVGQCGLWGHRSICGVGRLVSRSVGGRSVGRSFGLWGRSVGRLVGRSAVCMVGRRLWGRSVCWKIGISVSGRSVGRVGRSVWVGRSVCSGSDGGQLEGLR